MQEFTLLLDAVGSVALVIGAVLALGAQSRLRTTEAKRKALQARLEELEKRPSEGASSSAPRQQQAQKSTERKAETRRVAELEAALARSEEDRRALEARYEARLKELTSSIGTAATSVAPAAREAEAAYLPRPKTVHLSAGAAGVPRSATRAAKEPVTLLLASGNETAAELAEALKGAGYTVLAAATAAGTLQAARESKPTVIALDVQLGRGGDGFKALASLKADAALRDIPVVLICPVKDRDRAVELGAAGCVAAPAAPNVLLGAVSAALVAHRKRAERSRLAKVAKSTGAVAE